MNITETIWQNCKANPTKEALVFNGQVFSYQKLYQTSIAVTNKLLALGLKQGDVVATRLENPFTFLASVLAVAKIGAMCMPFSNKWSEEEKLKLLQKNNAKFILNPINTKAFEHSKLPNIKNIFGEELFTQKYTSEELTLPKLADNTPDAPWWIGMTSGTTGMPKSIYKTHAKTLLSCGIYPEFHNPEYDRVFVSLDLKMSFGLGVAIRTLLSTKTLIANQNAMPSIFFETILRDKPTNVTTSVAIMLNALEYAKKNKMQKQLFPHLKRITISGSKVALNLREDIAAYLCETLEVRYSSTETGPIALANNKTYALYPDSSGKIFPWVKYQIVGEDEELLECGEVGMLRFQTPIMTNKYIKDTAATQKHFKDGWFYTGDIGTIDHGGFLFISGRNDHVINIGGVKTHPESIETVLNTHNDVIESAVLQLEHPVTKNSLLAAVIVSLKKVDEKELKLLCAKHLNAMQVPNVFVSLSELPKNASGKLMRNQLAQMVKIETSS